jgi:hypothetical protein
MIYVRKIVSCVSETLHEAGQDLARPHQVAVVGAVIENPYPIEYVENLTETADSLGEELGRMVAPLVVDLLSGHVEAFGKGVLVGLDGELEHGSALIHNLRFGDVFRTLVQGTELLPAAEKYGVAGDSIDIPLKHKLDAKLRSHHQTATFTISDAPRPRELVVICAGANGGRPLARLAPFGTEVGISR